MPPWIIGYWISSICVILVFINSVYRIDICITSNEMQEGLLSPHKIHYFFVQECGYRRLMVCGLHAESDIVGFQVQNAADR